MSSGNPSEQDPRAEPQQNATSMPGEPDDAAEDQAAAEGASAADGPQGEPQSDPPAQSGRRRILIGSQRDPAAYRARRTRDWVAPTESEAEQEAPPKRTRRSARKRRSAGKRSPAEPEPPGAEAEGAPGEAPARSAAPGEISPGEDRRDESPPGATEGEAPAEPGEAGPFPPPNLRERLPPELEDEFDQAVADVSVEELLSGTDSLTRHPGLEPESRHTARVITVRRDDVFVELGGREQGCVSLRQFEEPPQPGAALEVVVQGFNSEDGLYELTIADRAVDVEDWSDLNEGMLVEARVTGHNTGGLECEVGRIRGFIPISQVAIYRVEDLAPIVGERFTCLVTEANPQRRNLVLSRRAVLEREAEEARQKLLDSLEPGQIHEGVVRKLVDFGAFVDIGGLDGLLHISQLAWGRVDHPREVLREGQKIQVKVEKVDRAGGKLSLAYRDLLENPWDDAPGKYPENSIVEGTVVKVVDFGAFVELEPGVEGLVHISQLAHKHVRRTSEVVKQGDKVQVLVQSVDREAQRISLSMKDAIPPAEPEREEDERRPETSSSKPRKPRRPAKPLRGGLGRAPRGDRFGLKW